MFYLCSEFRIAPMKTNDPEIARLQAQLKEAQRRARERGEAFKRDMEESQRRTARAVRAFGLSMDAAKRDIARSCAQLPQPIKRV